MAGVHVLQAGMADLLLEDRAEQRVVDVEAVAVFAEGAEEFGVENGAVGGMDDTAQKDGCEEEAGEGVAERDG